MKHSRFIVAVLLFAGLARAQHPDAGTVAFPFLNLSYDARAVAMGGANAGIPNGVYGVLSNPASIAFEKRMQVMGGFRQIIMDIWGGPLAFLYPMSKGVLAANLTTLTSGDFNVVSEDGKESGALARSNFISGGLSWAQLINAELSAGFTIKGVYNYLGADGQYYSADGFALDGGIQYRTLNDRLVYGAVFRNVGLMRSGYSGASSDRYPFPYCVEMGISYVPKYIPKLRVALDVNKKRGDYLNFEPGVELSPLDNLFLRLGYAFSLQDFEKQVIDALRGVNDEDYQKSSANSLSLGAGMATSVDQVNLKLDVALQFHVDNTIPALLISVIAGF